MINLLDLGENSTWSSTGKITYVLTTEINRIYISTIEMNNIIMGIKFTGSNTSDSIANTNYLWCHTSKGSNFSAWSLLFPASKFSRTKENGTHQTWKSHEPPSQQEPNIIPDKHDTAPTIWFPMFTGWLIYVPATHSCLMQIQQKNNSIHLVPT